MAALRPDRPDGELFADLAADYGTTRAIASTVIAGWLRQLGITADDVPAHAPERLALFRSITADLSLLVLIDNAEDAESVRCLLPTGSGNAVIVTSRRRLHDLVIDGFDVVDVPPLSNADALELIKAYRPRGERYPHNDLRQLTAACHGNALAICIVGAFLAIHRHYSPADLLAEVTKESVPALTVGDTSLGKVLTITYDTLPAAAQDLCRLMAACPGTEFIAEPLAAALVCEVALVKASLQDLVDRHLLTEHPGRRYRMPVLVGEHVRRLNAKTQYSVQLSRIERFAAWYLRRTAAADKAINPGPPRRSPVFDQLTATDRFATAYDAQAWYEREQHSVLASLWRCDHHGWDAMTVAFAEALWNLQKSGYTDADLVDSQRLGLKAALRSDHLLTATFHARMAFGLSNLGEHDGAIRAATDAVDRAIAADDPWARSMARSTLGRALLAADRPREAIAALTVALEDSDAAGDLLSSALRHRRIGQAYLSPKISDPVLASAHLRTSVELMRKINEKLGLARSLTYLAEALVASGQPEAALRALDEARGITADLGSARYGADIDRLAAQAHHMLGDIQNAVRHCNRALAALDGRGPRAEAERGMIDALRQDIVAWRPPPADPDRISSARILNAALGGESNYAQEGDWVRTVSVAGRVPAFRALVTEMFVFQARAVDGALDHGVRQFLAVDCGIPGPGAIHAQIAKHPGACVVYAFGDDQARMIADSLTRNDDHVAVVPGAIAEPETILYHQTTTAWLDFDQPVCVVLTGALQHCPQETDLAEVVRRFTAPLPSGSVVLVSFLTTDGLDSANPEHRAILGQLLELQRSYENARLSLVFRDLSEIAGALPDMTCDMPVPGCVTAVGWVR